MPKSGNKQLDYGRISVRMPIKLNKSFWPKIITKLLPSSDDPRVLLDGEISGKEFSKAISVFKFGTTFKSTESVRFPTVVKALTFLDCHSPPTVLDVGASDGTASLHILQNIEFEKYYIADLNIEALYEIRDDKCYFYDTDKNCILMVTKLFVIYSDFKNSIFPFNKLAENFLSTSPHANNSSRKIELINPEVKKIKGNIAILKHNIFSRWMKEKLDLIIAANILNKCYFSENQLRKAVNNLVCTLNDGGRLVIIDSRKIEKATIFRVMKKKIQVEKDINGGTEIRELILNTCLE
jgi:SAM-dependent methyltransferase